MCTHCDGEIPNKVSLSRTNRDLSRTRQTAFSVDSDLEKIAQREHILPFFRIGRFVGESGAKVEGLHFDHFYGRSLRTFHGRILSYVFRTEGSQRGHRGVTEGSQRGHRGVTEGPQRGHRGVTEGSQRALNMPNTLEIFRVPAAIPALFEQPESLPVSHCLLTVEEQLSRKQHLVAAAPLTSDRVVPLIDAHTRGARLREAHVRGHYAIRPTDAHARLRHLSVRGTEQAVRSLGHRTSGFVVKGYLCRTADHTRLSDGEEDERVDAARRAIVRLSAARALEREQPHGNAHVERARASIHDFFSLVQLVTERPARQGERIDLDQRDPVGVEELVDNEREVAPSFSYDVALTGPTRWWHRRASSFAGFELATSRSRSASAYEPSAFSVDLWMSRWQGGGSCAVYVPSC